MCLIQTPDSVLCEKTQEFVYQLLTRVDWFVVSGRAKDRSHLILEAIGRLLDWLERGSYTGPQRQEFFVQIGLIRFPKIYRYILIPPSSGV